jgi:hypothetical protein
MLGKIIFFNSYVNFYYYFNVLASWKILFRKKWIIIGKKLFGIDRAIHYCKVPKKAENFKANESLISKIFRRGAYRRLDLPTHWFVAKKIFAGH